jgi:hypothetical protein
MRACAGDRRRLTATAVLGGLALVAASLFPAAAEEPDAEPVEITAAAIYATPVTDAVPSTLTEDVPPTAMCVLFPELCPAELEPARDLLRTTIGEASDEAPAEPVHPLPPDTIAVSYLGGVPRYQSALAFELPLVPGGGPRGGARGGAPPGPPPHHPPPPAAGAAPRPPRRPPPAAAAR